MIKKAPDQNGLPEIHVTEFSVVREVSGRTGARGGTWLWRRGVGQHFPGPVNDLGIDRHMELEWIETTEARTSFKSILGYNCGECKAKDPLANFISLNQGGSWLPCRFSLARVSHADGGF